MSSENIVMKNFRNNRRADLIHIAGGQCNLCGYHKVMAALEFHHLDPTTKKFNLCSGSGKPLPVEVDELKKCILVCANCHREIHQGLYSLEELLAKRQYNTEIEQQILKQYEENIAPSKKYYCKNCGQEITRFSTTGYCLTCFHLLENTSFNKPSREELKQKIRLISFAELGREYNVSDNGIRKWCKSYNLPSTKKEIKKYTQEEWEKI